MIDTCSSVSRRTANPKNREIGEPQTQLSNILQKQFTFNPRCIHTGYKKTGQKSHATVHLNPRYSLLRVTTEISNFENAKEE
jgi:hypothetical protein